MDTERHRLKLRCREAIRRLHQEHAPADCAFDGVASQVLVGDGGKARAWGCAADGAPSVRGSYKSDRVEISYHGRVTTHLGDTDWFVEEIVTVDGVVRHRDRFA